MKDTFWTQNYNGCWIHGSYDRDLKRELITCQLRSDGPARLVPSIRAAKIRINRFKKTTRMLAEFYENPE